jgi:hypothetical protein
MVMIISLALMLPLMWKDLVNGDTNLITGTIMWAVVFLAMILIELLAARFSGPFTIALCRNPQCGFSWRPKHGH